MYLDVIGQGRIEIDQKLFGTNQVHLDIQLQLNGITMDSDEIIAKLSLPITAQQLMQEFKFIDV